MAYDPMNPFGLPSLGAGGASQNPLLSSMDMMRQAMTGLGQSAQTASGSFGSPMTPEDLEKKINELKVVENWLKLNLSMLSSSIQGLEVQLATVRTLRSFVAMGETSAASDASHASDPSPLEVALGLKPARHKPTAPPKDASASASRNYQAPPSHETPHDPPNDTSPSPSQGSSTDAPPSESGSSDTPPPEANANTAAAQAWWKMLENQFNQLASATTQANAAAQSAMASATSQDKRTDSPKKTAGGSAKATKAAKAAKAAKSTTATKAAGQRQTGTKRAGTKAATKTTRTKATRT